MERALVQTPTHPSLAEILPRDLLYTDLVQGPGEENRDLAQRSFTTASLNTDLILRSLALS